MAANSVDDVQAMDEQDLQAIGLGDLLPILQRRWLLALVCGFGAAVLVVVFAMRLTPLYEARAIITVDYGLKALDFQRDPETDRVELNMLNTIRDQLVAVPILRETIATSGLATSAAYRDVPDPVAVLRDRVKANTTKDSLSITLTLRDEYPERAQQALTQLLAAYTGKLAEAKDDKSQNALVFLKSQRDEELSRLESARAAEAEFMNRAGIVSNNADVNPLSVRLAALNAQLVELEGQIAISGVLSDQVTRAMAVEPAARSEALLAIAELAHENSVIEQQHQVAMQAAEVGQLAGRYGDRHPKLIEARATLDDQRSQLRNALESVASIALASHQRKLAQLAQVRQLISEQEQRLKSYRKDLLALGSLSEVTASHSQLYQTILTRVNEMEVNSSLSERKTKIIDPPTAGANPVNINKPLFAGLALVIGAVAAIGAALVAENLDTRIYGARQIQRITGLPLIGQIPQSTDLVPLGADGDPESPPHIAEAFRHIRASVRLARRKAVGCERIAVISCSPGEGKSTVTARLAMSLASMGARVLLIDADMRRPTQDDQLGIHVDRGLSLLLAGEPGIAPLATSRPNLDLLGVGAIPSNPGELLLSPLHAEALDCFSQSYDIIIVDTPPLSLVADGLSVAELMDDVILVLRDGHTDKDMLNLTLSRIAPVVGKIIGFVLNGDQSRAASYYGAKYRRGYVQDDTESTTEARG